MTTGLEAGFHEAMVNVYRMAKSECDYTASYFIQMVRENGGLGAAKPPLRTPTASSGFARLWECGRLDLSVEAVVLNPRWRPLFTEVELANAKLRLEELGYSPE